MSIRDVSELNKHDESLMAYRDKLLGNLAQDVRDCIDYGDDENKGK